MSLAAPMSTPASSRAASGAALGIAVMLGTASAFGLLLADGNPAVALAPVALAFATMAMRGLTLRGLGYLFVFVGLGLEGPNDNGGLFKSPIAGIGTFFHANLNLTIPISALKFSGFDLFAVLLTVLLFIRR